MADSATPSILWYENMSFQYHSRNSSNDKKALEVYEQPEKTQKELKRQSSKIDKKIELEKEQLQEALLKTSKIILLGTGDSGILY